MFFLPTGSSFVAQVAGFLMALFVYQVFKNYHLRNSFLPPSKTLRYLILTKVTWTRKLTQNTKKIKRNASYFYSTHILNFVFGENCVTVWLHWRLDVVKFIFVVCFGSKCCLIFDLEWIWLNYLIWGENLHFRLDSFHVFLLSSSKRSRGRYTAALTTVKAACIDS